MLPAGTTLVADPDLIVVQIRLADRRAEEAEVEEVEARGWRGAPARARAAAEAPSDEG